MTLSGGTVGVGAIIETLSGGTAIVSGNVFNSGTFFASGAGSLVEIPLATQSGRDAAAGVVVAGVGPMGRTT